MACILFFIFFDIFWLTAASVKSLFALVVPTYIRPFVLYFLFVVELISVLLHLYLLGYPGFLHFSLLSSWLGREMADETPYGEFFRILS